MSAIANLKRSPTTITLPPPPASPSPSAFTAPASASPASPMPALASTDQAAAKTAAALAEALDQTESVKMKLEACAAELSDVNAVLTTTVAVGKPAPLIEQVRRRQHRQRMKAAVAQNEAVEEKVAECGEELANINETLATVISERHVLTDALGVAATALAESQASEAKAAHAAMHDAITGLPNLTLFGDRLANALLQAKRHQRLLAVMFIDLDAFKAINDRHGHDVGDALLTEIGNRLTNTARAGDTVCRRSGDEFLILLPDLKDEAHSRKLAGKFRVAVAAAGQSIPGIQPISASVGVAFYPQHGSTTAALLVSADSAMYAAKKLAAGVAIFQDAKRT